MSVDDPESFSGFLSDFVSLSYDQWGPAHSSYSDPILITLILSFIQ